MLFIGLSVALIITDHQFSYLDKVRYHVNVFGYTIRYIANLPYNTTLLAYEYLQERSELLEKKHLLHNENIELHARLSKMSALKHKNRHLQALLNLLENDTDKKFTVAKLVGVHSSLIEQKIVIDKGSLDGVYIGQPVLGANGIIGQVGELTAVSATVMLISSPGFTVLGEIERSSLRVVVRGIGNAERLRLLYVPTTADIKIGDRIVTSGLDRKYPYGYPIGTVLDIERQEGNSFSKVHIKPNAKLNHNLEMLLVWPTQTVATPR